MLKIKKLYISNIGRFVETQTVDFDLLGSLVQVDGDNKNTGGSSGSGKSTIFNALDYLLGLNDLPTTVLQSRLTKESMNVHGIFEWDDKAVEIIRGKKGLKITVDGEQKDTGSKLAEEYLDKILGVPRHLFRKMLHKRQKEGGFFLDLTPKQTHEFLQDCLNLSDFRNKTLIIENKAKELESLKNQLTNKLESNRSSLKATQEAILALGPMPTEEVKQSDILKLKAAYDESATKFKEISDRQKIEIQELEKERPSVTVLPYDRSKLDQLEQQKNDLEKQKKDLECQLYDITLAERDRQAKVRTLIGDRCLRQNILKNQIDNGELAKKKAVELASQIKKIRDAICPTCNQSWLTETAKTKEAELLTELTSCKETIAASALAAEERTKVLSEIQDLNFQAVPVIDPNIEMATSQITNINSQIAEIAVLIRQEKLNVDKFNVTQNEANKAIMNVFVAKQVDLRNAQAVELNQIIGQTDLNRRALDISVQKMKSYEDAKNRYNNTLQRLKANESASESEVSVTDLKLKESAYELEKVEELKKIVKSFVSCSFDDALESIGDMSTRIIRNIPNMATSTIQFEGIRETKEGKIKEEVNAVISMDGEIGIPIKSLSGGERSAVDLAVDLAVLDFIESKTNRGTDIFILDEPFTGLDTVSIEMVLEVLKNSNINKKIIMVDHNELVKEMVGNRIVVVREDTTSKIIQ